MSVARGLSRAVQRSLASLLIAAAVWGVSAGMAGAVAAPPVPAPRLAVTGASLTVASTGQRLFGVEADTHLPIASTTKMMTALVVVQHVRHFSEIFTAPDWRAAPEDSQIGLSPGERMSVHDLMLALLLPSADDAAYDLAWNVGRGSVGRFVAEMNADAAALGLRDMHFANPIGFDAPGNYASPYDLTRLAAYMLAHHPFFAQTVRLSHATLRTGAYVRQITNTNTLLGSRPWITGVKTGHTGAAGYVLVLSGTRDGLSLVASVLGTSSEAARNANALALLSYGFDAFHQVTAVRAGQVLARLHVRGEGRRAAVIAAHGFRRVLRRSDTVRLKLALPLRLSGPRRAQQRVGTLTVLVNGRPAGRIALLLERAIAPPALLTTFAHGLGGPTTLGLLALGPGVLLIIGSGLRHRRTRTRLQR